MQWSEGILYQWSNLGGRLVQRHQVSFFENNKHWKHWKLFHPTFDITSWEFIWGQHVVFFYSPAFFVNNISPINLIPVTVDFSCKGINKQGRAMKLGFWSELLRNSFTFKETVFVNLKLTYMYMYTEDRKFCFQKGLLLQCFWWHVCRMVYELPTE